MIIRKDWTPFKVVRPFKVAPAYGTEENEHPKWRHCPSFNRNFKPQYLSKYAIYFYGKVTYMCGKSTTFWHITFQVCLATFSEVGHPLTYVPFTLHMGQVLSFWYAAPPGVTWRQKEGYDTASNVKILSQFLLGLLQAETASFGSICCFKVHLPNRYRANPGARRLILFPKSEP